MSIERHVFIAGCPRSGTSALTFLLNEHPAVAIGFERYKRLRAQLDPFHFTSGQFFAPVRAETDIRGELLYTRLRARWERGTVRAVGDKVPLYTRVLPQLLERFGEQARVVVMVRDPLAVARSFRKRAADPGDWWPEQNDHRLAMTMWNEALAAVRMVDGEREGDFLGERGVALLPYEGLFSGEKRWLEMLLAFLGVPVSKRLRCEHQRLAERWSGGARGRESEAAAAEEDVELRAYVEAHRDGELARWANERMAQQLEFFGESPGLGSGEEEEGPLSAEVQEGGPLSEQELRGREREQEQLLGEMRRPGVGADDELEVLEKRYVVQAGELARRGERLLCGVPSARARARVTFIVPHQRATSGGVYVIEQFARHMAADHEVCLAVCQPPVRAIPGVEVCLLEEEDLRAGDALPDADVLVYPADMRDGAAIHELPARVGRPVMLFQGYGTLGSPVVEENLARAREAVAIARWLVDLTLARGIQCAYVPEGLDREVFAPGPPSARRGPRVSVMTHRLDWKGLADALEALALVRAEQADVQVTLFGVEPVEGAGALAGVGTYVANLTRPEVAALLRESAVHVVASWEEGFGLVGAEAIACGAALASTDTKGSRDYAIDGFTALVSPPREPEALAENVLALLEDAQLRGRLVTAGQQHLPGAMPPWEEAARRMAWALLER